MNRGFIIQVLGAILMGCQSLRAALPDEDGKKPALNPRLTNSVPINVTLKEEKADNLPPVRRVTVLSSAGKFTFILPTDFRLEGGGGDHVIFSNQDSDRFLKFRLIPGAPDATNQLVRSELGLLLANQYPDSRIKAETTISVDNQKGLRFDVEWTIIESAIQAARIIYLPCGTGVLEVSLITSATKFEDSLHDLNRVLLSFRVAALEGDFKVIPRSSRL